MSKARNDFYKRLRDEAKNPNSTQREANKKIAEHRFVGLKQQDKLSLENNNAEKVEYNLMDYMEVILETATIIPGYEKGDLVKFGIFSKDMEKIKIDSSLVDGFKENWEKFMKEKMKVFDRQDD